MELGLHDLSRMVAEGWSSSGRRQIIHQDVDVVANRIVFLECGIIRPGLETPFVGESLLRPDWIRRRFQNFSGDRRWFGG